MATGYNVRVGDADRDAVATQLREHFADGRLTLEELNERLDQAFAAKTKADLNTVMRDLPQAARPTFDAARHPTQDRSALSGADHRPSNARAALASFAAPVRGAPARHRAGVASQSRLPSPDIEVFATAPSSSISAPPRG